MGEKFYTGDGMEQNEKFALFRFQKAAKLGHVKVARAQTHLHRHYDDYTCTRIRALSSIHSPEHHRSPPLTLPVFNNSLCQRPSLLLLPLPRCDPYPRILSL